MGRLRRTLVLAVALGVWGILAPARARAADPQPRAKIEGVTDKDLRDRIEKAIGTSPRSPESAFEARRRADDAAGQAVDVLRAEGYYDYDVEPTVSDGETPQAVVRIDPGERYKLGASGMEWLRPADPRAEAEAVKALALKPGAPGRAEDVVAAEGRAVAALFKRGYPDAKPETRKVIVDHATNLVEPTFRIDPGPLVRLDGLRVETKGRTNPDWVQTLAPWAPGDIYSPRDIAELERRLRETQVYQSVTVALAPESELTPEGERPVIVSLADRTRATVELGASYATTEGVGIDSVYSMFNVLHRADTLSFIARLATLESKLGVQFSLPHWRVPDQTLSFGPEAYHDDVPAYIRTGADVHADVRIRLTKYSFWHYGLTLEADRENSFAFIPGTNMVEPFDVKLTIATLVGGVQLDRTDDPLNPTHGWKMTADVQPTFVGDQEHNNFLRTVAQGSTYLAIDKKGDTVLAFRLKLGSIVNGTIPETPTDRRFFAGGGGSVRGYAYQGIGPHFPNGAPEGGLSLVESSFEVRQRLFGNWGMAAFIDAGSVGPSEAPDFSNLHAGVGVGARYLLKVAPIRFDVAYPLQPTPNSRGIQVYASIGQAF